jgi:lipoprotein-anchoring transpeptidase ErfK/SrfK
VLIVLAGGLVPTGLAAHAAPGAQLPLSVMAGQVDASGVAALLAQEPLMLGASLSPDPLFTAPLQPGAPLQPAATMKPSEADQPLRPKLLFPSGAPAEASPAAGAAGAGVPVAEPVATAPLAPQRQLVLDRQRRLLTVLENGQELKRFPVGVGMPGWETPVGTFSVIEKITDPVWEHPAKGIRFKPGPDNPLGSRWIGFYRDCKGRSGFNGQEQLEVRGCVTAGFHGTPNRASVGQAASHGCVRLFDEHVRELYELVGLGTTVKVLP